MIAYVVQGMSLGLSGAASPGPFQAFLIGQTLKLGWRRMLPAVLAPLITDGPIIVMMMLALTRLPAGFLRLLQLIGGVYVLYLAWKSLQTFRDFCPALADPDQAGKQSFWQAVAMNFLSPGPYIYWSLIAGPVLLRGWQEAPMLGVSFLLGFYFAMLGCLVLLVVLFGVARQLGPQVNRVLIGVSGLAMLGFGIYQIVQGVLG